MPNIFLEWNAADPISEYEIQRNNILEQLQGNRNTFINSSYLANMLWNGPAVVDNWGTLSKVANERLTDFIWRTITSGLLNIENRSCNLFVYKIYDMKVQEIQKGDTVNQLHIDFLPAGVYMIILKNVNKATIHKIIK